MDKKTTKNILKIILISVTFIFALWNIDTLISLIAKFFNILRPVIIGFAIAFILKNFQKTFKNFYSKIFKKNKSGKIATVLSTITVYIILIAIITAIILIVIPQLSNSVKMFKDNLDGYLNNAQDYLQNLASHIDSDFLENLDIKHKINSILEKTSQSIPIIIKGAFGFTTTLVGTITDIVIGFIISVYFVVGREKLWAQFRKVVFAFLDKKKSEKFLSLLDKTNNSFSNFIKGQLTESFILGSLCFIGMTIFRFPYAFLISVLVGATSLIPIVGAFIGTAPGVFILWLVKPSLALWFIVFIIVLQQIEGNLIYPRVVGTNVGLPALWVLLAITIGGGLYGILGMIISVPIMSLIYDALKAKVAIRLSNKNISEKQI